MAVMDALELVNELHSTDLRTGGHGGAGLQFQHLEIEVEGSVVRS